MPIRKKERNILKGLYLFKGMDLLIRTLVMDFVQVGGLFTTVPGDRGSIPGGVIPKTKKMVLDASWLNTAL